MLSAGQSDTQSREALEKLCRTYWYPLYRFVRSRGHSPDQAADLTQSFFTRLLERDDFEKIRKEKGRFRSFLLTALTHHLANERDRARAVKRGGQIKLFSLDPQDAESRFRLEPQTELTPELAFEQSWALSVLQQAYEKLKQEYASDDRLTLFLKLAPRLGGSTDDHATYQDLANELELSESAIKVNVHRMRKRYRQLLRDEISNTVSTPEDIDAELEQMFRILQRIR